MNKKKERKGNLNCVVVNCSNTYGNRPDLHFYSFPNRPWETERRKIWVNSVKRLRGKNEAWQPSARSRICSAHFVGGEKSNNPQNPAYNPTIFPEVYKKSSDEKKSQAALLRFQRKEARDVMKNSLSLNEPSAFENDDVADCSVFFDDNNSNACTEIRKQDQGCQVTFLDNSDDEPFVFECIYSEGSFATQAYIPVKHSAYSLVSTNAGNRQNFQKSSETQTFHNCHFEGYASITEEQQLQDIGGVSTAVFQFLLSISVVAVNSKLSVQDRLLLFLMKLKLGLTFSALGLFFNVHRTTASRIFKNILTDLCTKTKNLVFWPSRESVKATLPNAFKKHYPQTRVIIDCTELRSEEPPTVSQRIFLYSHYKHGFTVKFLIGIAPNGFICFISKGYGGRSSDGFIVNDSGFLQLLEKGDYVMADKGFPKILADTETITIIPPFLHDGRFTEAEVEETYNIAAVRIHVERAIQRVKTYHVLDKIPVDLLPHIDEIVQMCCVLVNFQRPIIKNPMADGKKKK